MKQLTAKQQHWQSIIEDWRQSGLSQSEYCSRHGIKLKQFYAWNSRLKKITEPKPANRGHFLPVVWEEASSDQGSSSSLKVLCQGVEIEVTHHTDPALFKKAITWLGGLT